MLEGWKDSYRVNHIKMDEDHQKLLAMMLTLHNAMKKGQSKQVLSTLVIDLENYANDHLMREEALLKERKHPDYDIQKEQHRIFMNKVAEFKNGIENGNIIVSIKVMPFLKDWFLNHIIKVDSNYKV